MKILKRGAGWILVCREKPSEYEKRIIGTASNSRDIYLLVRDRILAEQGEVMYALAIDGQNRITSMCEVARGSLHGLSISARDILRPMIACGASSFILVHNHPSGDPRPSAEDIKMTGAVVKAADIVGTPCVDHVIVGSWDRYSSLLDLGHI